MTREQGGGEQHGISQQLPLNQQIHKISLITRDLHIYLKMTRGSRYLMLKRHGDARGISARNVWAGDIELMILLFLS